MGCCAAKGETVEEEPAEGREREAAPAPAPVPAPAPAPTTPTPPVQASPPPVEEAWPVRDEESSGHAARSPDDHAVQAEERVPDAELASSVDDVEDVEDAPSEPRVESVPSEALEVADVDDSSDDDVSAAAAPAPSPLQPHEAAGVHAHNALRRRYGAGAVTHDAALAAHARAQAERCLAERAPQHGQYAEYDEGQNVYMTFRAGPGAGGGATDEALVHEACAEWGAEAPRYYEAGGGVRGLRHQAGQFTQAVWRGSVRIGVGVARQGGTAAVVVNYAPAGNLLRDAVVRENVGGAHEEEAAATTPRQEYVPAGKVAALQETAVRLHNILRANHDAPPLMQDPLLALHAQAHAERCLARGAVLQSPSPGEGQNVFCFDYTGYTPSHEAVLQECIEAWYLQRRQYDPRALGTLARCGNFTQMVWRATRRAGLGFARDDRRAYLVMHYHPQGNVYDTAHVAQNVCL